MNLVELDKLYKKQGLNFTDKNQEHSYLPVYDKILKRFKSTAKHVLEIGIYTGGSIKLWKDYFDQAWIIGLDIQDIIRLQAIKEDNRIELWTNQNAYNKSFIEEKFIPKSFDVIIDDGPHTLESQLDFINLYVPYLTDTGILIIEDVQDISWIEKLSKQTPDFLKKYIKIYDLRDNKGRYDDILFTIDKKY
tara:strand:+ start:1008 stop:1580 length:573 start_codon:yes stop_codon:yes gene_type:complete